MTPPDAKADNGWGTRLTLEQCPFGDVTCHCDDLTIVAKVDPAREGVLYGYVECDNCGARGPVSWADADSIEETAAYNWNQRTSNLPTPPVEGG